jgi:hypothetical protein
LKCTGRGKLPTGHIRKFLLLKYSIPLIHTYNCLICANCQDPKR